MFQFLYLEFGKVVIKTHLELLSLTEIADNTLTSDPNRSLKNMILLDRRLRLRDIGQLSFALQMTFLLNLNRNSTSLIRVKSITALKINMLTFRVFKTVLL